METIEYQDVVSTYDIEKLPISITTTEVNLTGSWKFFKPEFKEKISPCSAACPSNINIPKYIFYLLKNDIEKAVEILRSENPFPATCGRVCPHFCQYSCNRGEYDGEIQIREIEKFLGDFALNFPYKKPEIKLNKKVAIIGGGPAGLSCAYFLAKNGVNVTIFEKENFLGGLLIYGIPSYRLPKNIVTKEIQNILDIGNIEVKLNSKIDRENLKEICNNFDSVFVSVGLGKTIIPENLKIDKKFILSGYELLKEINLKDIEIKGNVAIIGGGNVAIDVARSVLRKGATPTIIYRRTINEMPAFPDEVEEAIEEKIKIIEKRIIISKKIENDEVIVRLGEVKNIKNGIVEYEKTDEILKFNKIIVATGQDKEFEIENSEKIFSGGDFEYGARTVTDAIASGKLNAFKIMEKLGLESNHYYNKDENFVRSRKDFDKFEIIPFEKINLFYFPKSESLKIEKLSIEERINNFKEINKKPSLDSILKEAKRCFSCGVCNLCKTCWFNCPDICVSVTDSVDFDYDHCKGCGVCSAECPRGLIEMVEDK